QPQARRRTQPLRLQHTEPRCSYNCSYIPIKVKCARAPRVRSSQVLPLGKWVEPNVTVWPARAVATRQLFRSDAAPSASHLTTPLHSPSTLPATPHVTRSREARA